MIKPKVARAMRAQCHISFSSAGLGLCPPPFSFFIYRSAQRIDVGHKRGLQGLGIAMEQLLENHQ